jgi:hypothetical protein
MTSELSKTKVIKPPKPLPNLKRPESIGNLNMQEAYDKFGSARIDGLKIVSIESGSAGATTGHIVAFYKWNKVLINIVQ